MVIFILSVLGILGNLLTVIFWLLDSGVFNYMIYNFLFFSNFSLYIGYFNINIVNGNIFFISVIGDILSDFSNVLVFFSLFINFVSVGQFVDNNCTVIFFF